jgi:hypothetical protein
MPKWQYRRIDLNELSPRSNDVQLLNAAGAEGWQLVAVTSNRIAYLKRPIGDAACAPDEPPSHSSSRRKGSPKTE